jgi:hypothetical protein
MIIDSMIIFYYHPPVFCPVIAVLVSGVALDFCCQLLPAALLNPDYRIESVREERKRGRR